MLKPIKFNLLMDNTYIRTIEDLREHFNITDMMDFYEKGLLQRWLKVRALDELVVKIDGITEKKDIDVARQLIRIFFNVNGKGDGQEAINEHLYSMLYERKKKDDLRIYEEKKMKHAEIIAGYHRTYEELCQSLMAKKEDNAWIKTSIQTIVSNYREIFKYHYSAFYHEMKGECPLAIFAVLGHEQLRDLFLLNEKIKEDLKNFVKVTYSKLLINGVEVENDHYIWKYAKNIGRETKQYWSDIESKGNRYMILYMRDGNNVRNAGATGEELAAKEVNGSFPILDGIDYRSNDKDHKLVYMEV